MKDIYYVNVIAGIVLILFSLSMIYYIVPNYSAHRTDTYLSPQSVPFFISYVILIGAILMTLISSFVIVKNHLKPMWPITFTEIIVMLVVIGMMIITTLLYYYVSKILAVYQFFIIIMLFIGERSKTTLLLLPTIIIATLYFIFYYLLNIPI